MDHRTRVAVWRNPFRQRDATRQVSRSPDIASLSPPLHCLRARVIGTSGSNSWVEAQAEISIGHVGVGIPGAVPREIVDLVFTIKTAGKAIANGRAGARRITVLVNPPHFVSKCG